MPKIWRDLSAALSGRRDFAPLDREQDQWLYPLSLEFTLEREGEYYAPQDAEGIPVHEYRSVGRQYNPTRVAAYGLAHWNRFRQTGQEDSRQRFLKALEWFGRAGDGVWRYHFDWGNLRAPWISCMAQGEGISTLVRGYMLTGNEAYLRLAEGALAPFGRTIAEGGFQSFLDNGDPFWEEYPSAKPGHVLNGYLYAVIGLIELRRVVGLSLLDDLLATARNTLEHNLRRWDLGYWSAYDLVNEHGPGPRNVCTTSYHSLHVSQLSFVGGYFESVSINEIAASWMARLGSLGARLRALGGKIRYRWYEPAQR